jgi:hypothetical protein
MVNKKALLIVGGVLLVDYLLAQVNKPKIYIVDDEKNYNAKVVPPFGIYINKSQSDNSLLLQHEMVHWKQYKSTGALLFYLRYFTEYVIYGYDNMPMEIEARKEVGESKYCIKNYTECVRNGKSKTVSNPNFRKSTFIKI